MSNAPTAAEKTITIEYLGTRGNPISIPATKQGTWRYYHKEGKKPAHGDVSAEPEEIARELLDQGGFREVKAAPAAIVEPPPAAK